MNLEQSLEVATVREFIDAVETLYKAWDSRVFPWFRGEPVGPDVEPLLPKLYRKRSDGRTHDENALLQFFRMRVPALGLPLLPEQGRTDQWMFVAQHVGLPTRLLDWSEGSLIALYFALRESGPGKECVVWMLNHQVLNRKSLPKNHPGPVPNEPTLTWIPGHDPEVNLYNINIRAAWELDSVGTELPVAIYPTNVHPRMSAQHSTFTVHGTRKESLNHMVGPDCLRCITVRTEDHVGALLYLRRLGVSESTLFPEPQGLARELEEDF